MIFFSFSLHTAQFTISASTGYFILHSVIFHTKISIKRTVCSKLKTIQFCMNGYHVVFKTTCKFIWTQNKTGTLKQIQNCGSRRSTYNKKNVLPLVASLPMGSCGRFDDLMSHLTSHHRGPRT